MNRTNLEHALIAVLMQIPFGLLGFWWAGCLPGIFFFLGREHAQWEKHIVHGGNVSGLPWFAGMGFLRESKDGRNDWLAPVIAVVALALIFGTGQ